MNIRIFGTTVWGDEPELPLDESVKQRQIELERALIKEELDYIDMGARKEGIRAKIAFLRNYSSATVLQAEVKQLRQSK